MFIHATHKQTGEPFVFESTTASAEMLANVREPERLLAKDQKIAYFERLNKIGVAQKIDLLRRHRDHLRTILLDLWQRALGPKDDEVHAAIRGTCLSLSTVLNTYKEYAKSGNKKFSELNLAKDLGCQLLVLKGKVPDVGANAAHVAGLEKAQRQVGDVLARAESGVRAWVAGASIAYRGSLATGWRNETKSDNGVAQRINLLNFDSDAFVTIPHDTWAHWADLEIVLNNKVKDKMTLEDLVLRADAMHKKPVHELRGLSPDDIERVLRQLQGIVAVEEQIRLAMASVAGYKRTAEGIADFGFVLQSSQKTDRELKSGNLYPLYQVAHAGLPLTEAELDVLVEDGEVKVRMPEQHVSMTVASNVQTYGDAIPAPYTVGRPTERMAMEDYIANPGRIQLRPTITVVRTVQETLDRMEIALG